jgi:hypothetical protein
MKRVGKLMETQATLDQWHDGLLEPAFKQFFMLDAHPALRHVNGAVNRSAKLLIVEKLAFCEEHIIASTAWRSSV